MFFNPFRLKVACCSIVSFLLDFEDTMSTSKGTAVELAFLLLLVLLITMIDEADGGNGQQPHSSNFKGGGLLSNRLPKIRHVRGKYKYKEEVIKKIEHDHPCKLTQAAVKITFPGMKEEVLVSFLGYKEPNLMPVKRCKGLCSNEALSPVACVPTKLRYKKVKMQIKTQYLGHDAQERFREVVLEEHEECGCRCLNVRPEHCMEPSLFNNETCSCQCDTSLYNRDQIRCETLDDRTWDPITCTCRRNEEGVLLDGPKQELDARLAAEAAGDLPPGSATAGGGHYHGGRHHHHHKKTRPGHDVDPAIINCIGDDCEECDDPSHFQKPGVAVMPKAKSTSSSTNGWTAIGVCTFLVLVFATTTIYYWQKAKNMAKDMFATKDEASVHGEDGGGKNGDDDDDDLDDELEVPSPPPKPSGKKMPLMISSSNDLVHSPRKELLNSTESSGIKSPVELLKRICDSKKMNQATSVNLPTVSPPLSPSHHLTSAAHASVSDLKCQVTMLPNGGLISSASCINIRNNRKDNDFDVHSSEETTEDANDVHDPDDDEAEAATPDSGGGGEKNIMELLLAAAAKRDSSNKQQREKSTHCHRRLAQQQQQQQQQSRRQSQGHHQQQQQQNGMAKAASMSELEASQLEPEHHNQHHHHHHHHHHHQQPNHRHHQSSTVTATASRTNYRSSNVSVNRQESHLQHRRPSQHDELEDDRENCQDCVHSNSLARPSRRRQLSNRQVLQHQHSFHHPHYMTLDSRHMSRSSHRHQRELHQQPQPQQPRSRSRLNYHGSFGQLLDDDDLLQQCLATLMMDAAILRQQQQLQQEQLKLQQEQLQQQQSVIQQQQQMAKQQQELQQKQPLPKTVDVALDAATDTQSVIESIAGDNAATIVTVDRLEVSVEVDNRPPSSEDSPC